MNKSQIINELITCQLKNIKSDKKLQYNDLQRISKYINNSVFDQNNCSIWNGYITNYNSKKGTYINFYFRNKKTALHRLLYINFVNELQDDEYLKFTCNNKGTCCNVNHMQKFKYNIDGDGEEHKESSDDEIHNIELDDDLIISLY